MALAKHFKANLWFNACFNFFMWITYSVLSCKLAKSFWTVSIFSYFGKNVRSLWNSCNLSIYPALTSEKYSSLLSSL